MKSDDSRKRSGRKGVKKNGRKKKQAPTMNETARRQKQNDKKKTLAHPKEPHRLVAHDVVPGSDQRPRRDLEGEVFPRGDPLDAALFCPRLEVRDDRRLDQRCVAIDGFPRERLPEEAALRRVLGTTLQQNGPLAHYPAGRDWPVRRRQRIISQQKFLTRHGAMNDYDLAT